MPDRTGNVPSQAAERSPEASGKTCGVVMPISAIDGCAEAHWVEVRQIIYSAIESAGFTAQLVSEAEDVGIIQKRIVQNLYENPIVVCDVSAKNPNVMFELGMRLAFDKPTIIVKDDKTAYSFDTAQIEHLTYPRDLRFSQIVKFKEDLADKINGTVLASQKEDFTTFLKHFGRFTVAKLETASVPKDEFVLQELAELRREFRVMASKLERSDSLRSDLEGFGRIMRKREDDRFSAMVREAARRIIRTEWADALPPVPDEEVVERVISRLANELPIPPAYRSPGILRGVILGELADVRGAQLSHS
jgi:hypothetical protein